MVDKIIIILLFGLAWGSFLNVVIFRLPLGMSLLKPPSFCPECKRKIRFYDNIPVISYAVLRGKCRTCGSKIPLSTLLVEILTPMSFYLIYQKYSLSLFFVASCLFASAMIVLGFIDFYHKILPDEITLPCLVLALVIAPFRSDLDLRQALIGAVAGAVFLLFIYGVYYLLRKKEGLGMGDVTMMLLIGAFLGLELTFFTLIVASFAGSIVGVLFILFRKKDLQYSLPFGTFLAPAAFFALLWGDPIIQAYLHMFRAP